MTSQNPFLERYKAHMSDLEHQMQRQTDLARRQDTLIKNLLEKNKQFSELLAENQQRHEQLISVNRALQERIASLETQISILTRMPQNEP